MVACSGGGGQSDPATEQSSGPVTAQDSWKSRFATVDVDFYNNPVVEDKDGELSISSQSGPAGLFFRKSVLRAATYRVTVSGETGAGSTALRIKFDDTEPIFVGLNSMNGDFSFEFSDVGNVELLIYSDTAYRYDLAALSIEQCASCVHSSVSNARLKTRILADNPELEDLIRTDTLRAAEVLTDWVAQIVDQGDPLGPTIRDTALIEVSRPGWLQDNLWDADLGGTFCQGFAAYLDKVFSLFGIKSFVLTMGYDQTYFTHVTNVVVIDQVNGKRFYMFDPTFNGTFVDAFSGAWVDLETLFEQYAEAGMEGLECVFESQPISRTKFVYESSIDHFLEDLFESGDVANCPDTPREDGLFVCRDFSGGLLYFSKKHEEGLSQMGIDPQRILESLLIQGGVISTNWVDAEDDRDAFEALLQQNDIP